MNMDKERTTLSEDAIFEIASKTISGVKEAFFEKDESSANRWSLKENSVGLSGYCWDDDVIKGIKGMKIIKKDEEIFFFLDSHKKEFKVIVFGKCDLFGVKALRKLFDVFEIKNSEKLEGADIALLGHS